MSYTLFIDYCSGTPEAYRITQKCEALPRFTSVDRVLGEEIVGGKSFCHSGDWDVITIERNEA